MKSKSSLSLQGKIILYAAETLLLILFCAWSILYVTFHGPSEVWSKKWIGLFDESSAAKFVPRLYFSEDEISSMMAVKEAEDYEPTDTSLISIRGEEPAQDSGGTTADAYGLVDEDGDGIILEPVKGRGYEGYMMVVKDASRVIVGSVPANYGIRGDDVQGYVQTFGGVAGVNAGGFLDPNGRGDGSTPDSVTVIDGKIYYAEYGCGGGIAAIDSDHVLHVAKSMSPQELIDNDIQYACCYGPVLISNGVMADPDTLPVSINPRTAIGQRADGAFLLLVIDGRQVASMGASFQDIAEIMARYGAVNAINMDGGSSSMMWYRDGYVNNSSSVVGIRHIPTSFVVLQEGEHVG